MYEVLSRITPVMGDFPLMDVDYFDSKDEAEAYAKESIKRKDVDYVVVNKITKLKTRTIRSFTK